MLESGLALESCSAGKHYTCGLVRESGLQSWFAFPFLSPARFTFPENSTLHLSRKSNLLWWGFLYLFLPSVILKIRYPTVCFWETHCTRFSSRFWNALCIWPCRSSDFWFWFSSTFYQSWRLADKLARMSQEPHFKTLVYLIEKKTIRELKGTLSHEQN